MNRFWPNSIPKVLDRYIRFVCSLKTIKTIKTKKNIFSLIFLTCLMNYFIRTLGIWKNNISTKFHKIFFKKYWTLSGQKLIFGDPLEKSIFAMTRIIRDNFIRNKNIKYFLLVGECIARDWTKDFWKNWNLNFWRSCMENSTIFGKN